MPLSANDIAWKARKYLNQTSTGTDANVTTGVACRLMSMQISGTGALSLACYDATAASGNPITIRSAANTTEEVDFGPQGVYFGTGLTVVSAGTGLTSAVVTYIIEGSA